ncbi:MAG: tryptophan 7-halogenase [Acidobacteriaceae bacterium]
MEQDHLEVCIVGGGPGGSAAALRLARLGHRVGVIEKARFPRFKVGESVGRGLWTLLDVLEVREHFVRQDFLYSEETLIRWDMAETERLAGHAGSVLVNRASFDALLLRQAEHAGAQVLQPARAAAAVLRGGVWQLEVKLEGRSTRLTADYLVDASGRRPFLPGARTRVSPPTLALCGYVRTAGSPRPLRTEAISDGWCWGAPVPGQMFSAMVFLSPETVRRRENLSLEELWRMKLAKAELFQWMATLPLVNPLTFHDATTDFATDFSTNLMRVGEASFTLDPMSSSGVEKAIQTGCIAAIALHTMLHRPERADVSMKFCNQRRSETVSAHAAWAAEFYSRVERFRELPFWLARSQSSSSHRPSPAMKDHINRDIALSIQSRVQLSRNAHLIKEPCITGDEICERTALLHPSLDRPVAFLGGIELGSLLAKLPEKTSIGALLHIWSAEVSSDHARRVAQWLLSNRILELVG